MEMLNFRPTHFITINERINALSSTGTFYRKSYSKLYFNFFSLLLREKLACKHETQSQTNRMILIYSPSCSYCISSSPWNKLNETFLMIVWELKNKTNIKHFSSLTLNFCILFLMEITQYTNSWQSRRHQNPS